MTGGPWERLNSQDGNPISASNPMPVTLSITPSDVSLTDGHILVGDNSNVAADVAMSGDTTIADTGVVTIANSAITTAKIAANAVNLTTKVTGALPTANGGTGHANTAADGHLLIGSTSGTDYVDAALGSSTLTVTPGSGTLSVDLPTHAGVTAGTYTTITSITVNAQGVITALTAS